MPSGFHHVCLLVGASVDDYYLAAQNTQGVQPPSRLTVTAKSAALSNGRLQAVFDVSIPFTQSTLGSVGVIYAAGPVDSTGALQQHTYVSLPDINKLELSDWSFCAPKGCQQWLSMKASYAMLRLACVGAVFRQGA